MKKALLVIFIVAIAMFAITACANDPAPTPAGTPAPVSTPAPTPAPVETPPPVAYDWQLNDGNPATITFEWWGGDARHEAINNAVAIFMDRYPHITVNTIYGAFGGYLDRLTMDLAAGTEADVLQSNFAWVHALGDGYNVFANHNTLPYLDLTEWSDDLRAFTTTRDGELSGVPHGITGRVVIYNTEMFPGGFPATWDELIEVGAEIAANNTAVDGGNNRYAFFPVGYQSWDIILMTMILNEYNVNLQAGGQILPSVDQVEAAFEMMGRAIDAGALPTFVQQEAPLDTTNPVWMQGRAGGLFEWVGNIFLAAGNFGDNDPSARQVEGVGVALLPTMSAGTSANSMQRPSLVHAVTQGAVNRGVDHIAAYFLNFIYTDPEALLAIGDQFGVPLARSAASVADSEGQVWGLMADGLELLVANTGDMCHLFEDPNLRPARAAAIEAFRTGGATAREAAERWVNEQQSYLNAMN
ncbi:MAG: extracellular solute-binding protein [Defluviitaleaceae bacterium]|nr:extracellular solute-binding protein [Defluviitaleaceae bacterium]